MSGYLNTHARSNRAAGEAQFKPTGRVSTLFGVFVGFVKDVTDVQKNGRLRVWIPEFGSAPDNPDSWIIVNYCSPFAGATNGESLNRADVTEFEGTQTSYGLWMIPPDINNQVLVMFINGDASRGIWIGSLYNQYMNNMVPAMSADTKNFQFPGKEIPVAEYNKTDSRVNYPDRATHPYQKTKFRGVSNQGLINDRVRGVTTSSARRESPSQVYGILTPGPALDPSVDAEKIKRAGGSSLVMDDGVGTEYMQIATKSGAQVRIDETNGFVYMINRDGTAWVQMDKDGNIDIFGARDVSVRAQRDFNIRADRNINIEAGQNIFIKAAKDTTRETAPFTYDVNNRPQQRDIPFWKYVGEGNGQGGNIVMQALNNWHSTTKNTAFLTVEDNNMNILVENSYNLTTSTGSQNFRSNKGIKITTDATIDMGAKSNIRVGSADGVISVIGKGGIALCSDNNVSAKAGGQLKIAGAGGADLDCSVKISGTLSAVGVISSSSTADLKAKWANLAEGLAAPLPNGSASSAAAPDAAQGALNAASAAPAQVKPLNDKINILPTWVSTTSNPEDKFKRNSQPVQTTVSRLATYEPCPEHTISSGGYVRPAPTLTQADITYGGSPGNATASPPAREEPTGVGGDDPEVKELNLSALECQLRFHEGVKNVIYLDTKNLPTGGIGHLLRSDEISRFPLGSPVSDEQVSLWFREDCASAIRIAINFIGGDAWAELSDCRKRALVDLAFNVGGAGLSRFVNFKSAMLKEDYLRAGEELRNSRWFTQVGRRGPNIIAMIAQDVDPTLCGRRFPE